MDSDHEELCKEEFLGPNDQPKEDNEAFSLQFKVPYK